MSASNYFENSLLRLIFTGVAISGLATNGANANLYISLHTADPGEAGTQNTNETIYAGYARATVARSTAGFTVTNNVVTNTALVSFPECTDTGQTVTHFAVGTVSSGATSVLFKGQLQAPLAISNGITPVFNPGAISITAE